MKYPHLHSFLLFDATLTKATECFPRPAVTLAEAMGEDGMQPDSWLVSSSAQPLFNSQLSPAADLVVAVFLTFTGRQLSDCITEQQVY